MRFEMKLGQLIVLLSCSIVIRAENQITKIWSVTGATNSGASVGNNPSDSIVIPYQYARRSRDMNIDASKQYVFRPRTIPLSEQPQESNVYYTQDKYKSEILFPGNYFTIAKEKSNENIAKDSAYNALNAEPFKPKTIPLMRGNDFQRRSLNVEESVEEPEEDSEVTASRRSLSYVLGVDEDEDAEDEDGDEGVEEDEDEIQDSKSKKPHGLKLKKVKKYSKYMMPLLLAYKLKYFALVPVLISGLILLVGATGMAGFFFALFAAVMGLQKGSY